jgi:hypothetical protein
MVDVAYSVEWIPAKRRVIEPASLSKRSIKPGNAGRASNLRKLRERRPCRVDRPGFGPHLGPGLGPIWGRVWASSGEDELRRARRELRISQRAFGGRVIGFARYAGGEG